MSTIKVLSIFLLWLPTADAAEFSKKILVIHSYPPNSWTTGIDEGLMKKQRGVNFVFERYHFHSEHWRNRPIEELQKEKAKIVELVKQPRFDGYILVDDESSELLRDTVLSLKKPVIFTGINHSVNDPVLKRYCLPGLSATALLEDYPYQKTFDALKRIQPKPKRHLIIASSSTTSDNYINGLHDFLKSSASNTTVVKEIHSNSWETWKDELLKNSKNVDVVWVFVPYGVRDRLNEQISPSRIGAWLKNNVSTKSIGEITLSGGVDIRVGMKSEKLGEETVHLFAALIKGQNTKCPIASGNYFVEVVEKKR
jgi:hypothetical protein